MSKRENNSERVQAVQNRRKSNAAGTHADRRTKRNRDRNSQKRNAIRESRD